MPYINEDLRRAYDQDIESLIAKLKELGSINGHVNYCISRIVAGAICPNDGWNYTSASDAVKAFECAKLEFVRRILNHVEDNAINRNGDIKEYFRE
jgi:hypothetical protein